MTRYKLEQTEQDIFHIKIDNSTYRVWNDKADSVKNVTWLITKGTPQQWRGWMSLLKRMKTHRQNKTKNAYEVKYAGSRDDL